MSLYIGAYLLEFFGISLPVLRLAGGLIIARSAWQMLNDDDDEKERHRMHSVDADEASKLAFYPLTMPITTGPGTISVAVALGTSRPTHPGEFLLFLVAATIATGVLALLIYVLYRNSPRVSRAVGPTGTNIIVRLSAFLLFCIGIQVMWNGAAELLASLPAR